MLYSNIRSFIKQGKNLVYFASGTFSSAEHYRLIPYDNVFLVDKSFRSTEYDGINVFMLKMDCIDAVHLFEELSLKIDCFVSFNDGSVQGEGPYPIMGNNFFGYVYPILNSEFIHIGNRSYYGTKYLAYAYHRYYDFPHESKVEILSSDPEYIDPLIFSSYSEKTRIFKFTKGLLRVHQFKSANLSFFVKHESIWTDKKNLDAIFVRYNSNHQKSTIEKYERNAYAIKPANYTLTDYPTYSVEEIIKLCEKEGWGRIGFTPMGESHLKTIKILTESNLPALREVYFYHLNRNDYSDLYKILNFQVDTL